MPAKPKRRRRRKRGELPAEAVLANAWTAAWDATVAQARGSFWRRTAYATNPVLDAISHDLSRAVLVIEQAGPPRIEFNDRIACGSAMRELIFYGTADNLAEFSAAVAVWCKQVR